MLQQRPNRARSPGIGWPMMSARPLIRFAAGEIIEHLVKRRPKFSTVGVVEKLRERPILRIKRFDPLAAERYDIARMHHAQFIQRPKPVILDRRAQDRK